LGATRVIGIEPLAKNCDMALELGADDIIPLDLARVAKNGWSADKELVKTVREATGGIGPDVCVEMAGLNTSVNNAIQAVRRGGEVVLFGLKQGNYRIQAFDRPFRATASGERYNMYKRSAAHKTLPMGTHILVLNLSSKKSSVVRINDRGPFVKGRIIDLSYAAAKEIGLVGPGVVKVKIVALGKEVGRLQSDGGPRPLVELRDLEKGDFTIQVGAFEDGENALSVADRLKVIFDYVHIAVDVDRDKKTLYKVQVSRSKTLSQAGKVEKKLEDMGFTKAFIVRI